MKAADVPALARMRDRLLDWAVTAALPVWAAHGRSADGAFHELLATDLSAPAVPRRSRVTGRQLYCFTTGPELGWQGDWADIVETGFRFQRARLVLPDGTIRNLLDAQGQPLDDRFVLYNQAFGLYGWSAVARAADRMGRPDLRAEAEEAAMTLRARLMADYRHPQAGFYEDAARALPLEANPHMHLFETCMAWEEAGGDAQWTALADEIAELALARMIAPEGWLKEHFAADWTPLEGERGRLCEPGHQFEWAWLLVRWGRSRGRADALAAARRLAALAEAHGVDPVRGAAVMEVLDDGSPHDPTARLWAQTERLKAHVALARAADDEAAQGDHAALAIKAAESILSYLDVTPAGLWRDSLSSAGNFRDEPAPASTFYHLICAIEVLKSALSGAASEAV